MSANHVTHSPVIVFGSLEKADTQTTLINKLCKEGQALYGKSFIESRNVLLGALYLQLIQIDFIPATIESMVTEVADTDFTGIDPILSTSDKISLVQRVREKNLPAEQRLRLAETLRWLGHCYQNIDDFKSVSDVNDARFHFVYGTAEELLKLDDSEAARLELAELYYNTGFFMHLKTHPKDYLGACETYEKALALNSSETMLARVRNMRSKLREAAGVKETPAQFKTDVLTPYIESPKKGQDPFLVAMYYNNYAKLLLCESEPNLEAIDEALSHTTEYMEKAERGEASLHAYFPIFYKNLAELRLLQNNSSAATEAYKKADEHAQRNKGSSLI